ncbi:MAG: GWxTD domain-containing protein, partial [Gemmatimonadota bacterium]
FGTTIALAGLGLVPLSGGTPLAGAQERVTASPAEGREQVTFDVVRLFGVEGKTLVEIYSRIPTSALSFTQAAGRHEAALAFELTVRKGDEVVLQDSWRRTKSVSDPRMLESSHVYFVETHAFLVPPGTYELVGTITDAGGRELGTLRRTLEAPEESPPASDLLLVSRILADTSEALPETYDPTRKNRLVLNPNPGQVYSTGGSPLVYFYYEFENVEDDPLALVRVVRFRDAGSGAVVKEMRAPKVYQPGWTVDFGAVNVAGLKQGSYTLDLSWEPEAGRELPDEYEGLTRSHSFAVVREPAPRFAAAEDLAPRPPAGAAKGAAVRGAAVDYYEGYGVAELDSVFELLDVFFTDSEEKVYAGLTPEGKRTFLNRFWAVHDPTPSTAANEYQAEVNARLAEVEDSFSTGTDPGHRTPRGRIWLRCGKPDRRIERVLETGFSAPYEVWIYYDTGYKYVFLDEFRNRRYILLTSTDPEEQGRPDWQERLPSEAVLEILRE